MTTPLRVLFVAFSRSSLGHVIRMRTAAVQFARAGHHVAIAVHEEARPLVERAGLSWIGIEEIPPALDWLGMTDEVGLRAFARTRLASPAYVEQSLKDELRAIDDFTPDAVISDMRNTASVAASMRDIPAFTVHNLRLFRHPMHAVLPEVIATLGQLGISERNAHKVLGDAVLVPDVSHLDPLTDIPSATASLLMSLVPEIRHIGPVVPESLRLGVDTSGEPLLNVTLGGSGVGEGDLVRIISAASRLGVGIAVTLGSEGAATVDLVARIKAVAGDADIDIAGFRHDAADLMARSTAAVVHGGHASMLEGLLTATPLVFVPQSEEQRGNAARVAALGLGAVVAPGDGLEALTLALRGALNPANPSAHRNFAAALRAADGASEMVRCVSIAVALRGTTGDAGARD